MPSESVAVADKVTSLPPLTGLGVALKLLITGNSRSGASTVTKTSAEP